METPQIDYLLFVRPFIRLIISLGARLSTNNASVCELRALSQGWWTGQTHIKPVNQVLRINRVAQIQTLIMHFDIMLATHYIISCWERYKPR
jgi:hypothetical protein